MLCYKYRTVTHLAQGRQQKAQSTTEDNTHMNVWGHLSKEKSNGALRNDGCTCYRFHTHTLLCFWHIWVQVIFPPGLTCEAVADASVIACVTTLSLSLHPIASYSLYPKVVSMAKPNKSTMKHAIQFVGECYSMHRLDPSVGSSDCFYFQNLSESLNIKFHNCSLSSTLTRRIVLVLFKMQKGK